MKQIKCYLGDVFGTEDLFFTNKPTLEQIKSALEEEYSVYEFSIGDYNGKKTIYMMDTPITYSIFNVSIKCGG